MKNYSLVLIGLFVVAVCAVVQYPCVFEKSTKEQTCVGSGTPTGRHDNGLVEAELKKLSMDPVPPTQPIDKTGLSKNFRAECEAYQKEEKGNLDFSVANCVEELYEEHLEDLVEFDDVAFVVHSPVWARGGIISLRFDRDDENSFRLGILDPKETILVRVAASVLRTSVLQLGRDIEIVTFSDYSNVYYGNHSTPYPTHGNTLNDRLEEIGVTLDTVTKLVLVGDESSRTSGLRIEITARQEIEWIWSHFFWPAEPYKYWLPSGNRKVHVFVDGRTEPAAKLGVNETDSTSLKGDVRYMCRGFNEYILRRFNEVRQKNSQGEKSVGARDQSAFQKKRSS